MLILGGGAIIATVGAVGLTLALTSGGGDGGAGPTATEGSTSTATTGTSGTQAGTAAALLPSVTPPANVPDSQLGSGVRASVLTGGCGAQLRTRPTESADAGVVATLCREDTAVVVTNEAAASTYVFAEGFLWWRVIDEQSLQTGWMKEMTSNGESRQLTRAAYQGPVCHAVVITVRFDDSTDVQAVTPKREPAQSPECGDGRYKAGERVRLSVPPIGTLNPRWSSAPDKLLSPTTGLSTEFVVPEMPSSSAGVFVGVTYYRP